MRRSSGVVTALRAAAVLRAAAGSGGVSVGELTALLAGDAFSRAAALHALGLSPDPLSSDLLVDALDGDQWSAEHAAWALGGQSPVRRAAPALARSVQKGGFAGFIAELTLEAWAANDAGLVADALSALEPDGPSGRAGALAAAMLAPASGRVAPGGGGQVIAQLHLHAPLEGDLRSVGSGASGGLATLAVNLAAELADRPEVDRVPPRPAAAR